MRYHRADEPESRGPAGATRSASRCARPSASLRERVLALRDALPAAQRAAAAQAIAERIIALPSFAAARTVLLTLPFRSEWDTLPLVRAALAAGKTVVLPRVDAGTRMLALHAIRDPDADVAPGYRGIPEPAPHCPRRRARRRSTGCWCPAWRSTPTGGAWATAAATTTGCSRCCRARRRASPARSTLQLVDARARRHRTISAST